MHLLLFLPMLLSQRPTSNIELLLWHEF